MTPRRIPTAGMTLTELRRAFPELFYKNQTWMIGERFMGFLPVGAGELPTVARTGDVPTASEAKRLPRAVDLAHAYVRNPTAPEWQHYWWCADVDQHGQRVYVGGVCEANGHKWEVHRHLHLSDKWAIAA